MSADVCKGGLGMMMVDIRIIESNHLMKSESHETERSRKRCAKKPWAKRKYITVTFPDPDIYRTPQGYICHPSVAKRLREELKTYGALS